MQRMPPTTTTSWAAAAVTAAINTEAASLQWQWFLGTTSDGKYRLAAQKDASTKTPIGLWIYLGADVARALGWDSARLGAPRPVYASGTLYEVCPIALEKVTATEWSSTADYRPAISSTTWPPKNGDRIKVVVVSGDFLVQPQIPALNPVLPSSTEGFLEISQGDARVVVAVKEIDATTFEVVRDVTDVFKDRGYGGGGLSALVPIAREGDSTTQVDLRQIWFERDSMSNVLLRAIASTSKALFNDASYDQNGWGMGAGVPYSAYHRAAWQSLSRLPYWLVLFKPTSLIEILESAMSVRGAYCVMSGGQISLRVPALTSASVGASFTLTESNKASVDDRLAVSYSADGLINRVIVKYNFGTDGEARSEYQIEDAVSSTDFGVRKAVEIRALGLDSATLGDWVSTITAVPLAYFSREVAIGERTFNASLIDLVPGDSLLITDSYLPDPTTGTRGVTSLPAWVLSAEFDLARGTGTCRLAMIPDAAPGNLGHWGASALVDHAAANAGYVVVDGSTRYLACEAHEYSHADDAIDVTWFSAGDVIDIVERSPANPAAPVSWTSRVVESVDSANGRIYLAATLAAWDTALYYVVGPADIAAVQATQKTAAFLASATTDSTGAAAHDAYRYGGYPSTWRGGSASAVKQFCRHPDTVDDVAESLPVHHWNRVLFNLNNLHFYKCSQVVLSEWPLTAITTSATSYTWVMGPLWVPCHTVGKGLSVVAFMSTSNAAYTASVRVRASSIFASGASATTLAWSYSTATDVELTSTSTTTEEKTGTLALPQLAGGQPEGCWLTVEIKTSNVLGTATLSGIYVGGL